MGSNVGTTTPYIIDFQPYQPPEEYPFLQSLYEDSPQYSNGRRVGCSLDGFAISCSRASSLLDTGGAIPAALAQYQHLPGFSIQNHGLGLFTVPDVFKNTSSGRIWAAFPDDRADGLRVFQGGTFNLNVSWNLRRQLSVNNTPSDVAAPRPPLGTDCDYFVSWLTGLIEPRIKQYVSRTRIGKTFATNLSTFNKTGVTGIKKEFTEPGQGSGAYRHFLGGAASVLLEIGLAKLYQDYSDSNQRDNDPQPERRAEAVAELAGTQAGADLGALIEQRDNGKLTADQLKEQIFDLFCDK